MILKATSICCDPTPKSLSRREFENITHFGTLKKIAGVASTVVPLAKPLPGMQKTLSTTSVSRVTSLLLSTLLNSFTWLTTCGWTTFLSLSHYDHPVLHSALILIRSGYLIFINMMMLFKLGDCRQVLSTKSWPSCATKTRN